jgi:hypothetical protein
MYFRPAIAALFIAFLIASGSGCKKTVNLPPSPPTVLSPDTAASVHWLGKKRLGITASAYYFTRIWQFSQGSQLERQTLTKLATTPGQWLPGGTHLTADAVPRLWLALNDLVQEESYLEIRIPTNSQPSTLNSQLTAVLAIRLGEGQMAPWQTNLAALLEPLTGVRRLVNADGEGFSLRTTNVLNVIQLTRVGDWAIVSTGPLPNPLTAEIAARIERDGLPFVSTGTNLWLEAVLDLPRLSAAFPLSSHPIVGEGRGEVGSPLNSQLKTLSTLTLKITGDGANVITRSQLTFTQPFAAPLEPWHLPVELMHEPLTSFTAMRGVQSWLDGWKPWHALEIGTAPGQLYFWSLAGSPYQAYLAAPLPDASHQVAALSETLLQKGNPWLATNGYISFNRAADANGVTWGSLPDIKPFIKSAGTGSDGFLFAGLLPDTNNAAAPPPAGMIQDILHRTNLVYYDWEITGPRLQPMLQLGQTARQIARRPQIAMDSAGINWLAMLIPRLGTSATIITRTGPAELTLYRRSTLGFNALELHLLADWLESPQFPR